MLNICARGRPSPLPVQFVRSRDRSQPSCGSNDQQIPSSQFTLTGGGSPYQRLRSFRRSTDKHLMSQSSAGSYGSPIAQLMHDKGRALQDFKRRMWLQELLDEVHTAEVRDLPVQTTSGGGSSSGAGVGLPGVGLGINLSTTGSTLHSKPPGGTKNLPISFRLEEEEGTNQIL